MAGDDSNNVPLAPKWPTLVGFDNDQLPNNTSHASTPILFQMNWRNLKSRKRTKDRISSMKISWRIIRGQKSMIAMKLLD
ncbi:hypothetical protein SLA2020_050420 [Shorea laevis]